VAILDSDLAHARLDAALAGSFKARLAVLAKELDLHLQRERELAEQVDLGDGETEAFEGAGLEELLQVFVEEDDLAAESLELLSSLLQRKVNRMAFADLREERERVIADQHALSDALARYTELSARWVAVNSQGDPARGCTLAKIEKEEKESELKCYRLEEADAAAAESENALERLRAILHDAVDWVPGDKAAQEADTAILRPERVGPADPWLGAAQVTLSRARRAVEEIGRHDSGEFQVEVLKSFADQCIQGLAQDLARRDGTDRALQPVTWTLTTVRALRGSLSRFRGDLRHRIEDLQARRAQLLQRGSR